MAIYLDAMGGDFAPIEILKGAIIAKPRQNHEIKLLGDRVVIEEELQGLGAERAFEIIDCPERISMGEEPTIAVRSKKNSSISKGCMLISQDENSAFVSAGSTGALLAGGLMYTGRMRGMARAAIGTVIPGAKPVLLLDAGANADLKPEALVQFAFMGKYYMQAVHSVKYPKVALANIGTEETKGNAQAKIYYEALSQNLDGFAGNMEPSSLLMGEYDVVVSDGFTGNIILKTMEGSIAYFMKSILSLPDINEGAKESIAALQSQLDPSQFGGAPFLGLNGCLIKAHGSSKAEAISNAIRQACVFLDNGVLAKIKSQTSISA